MSNLAKIRFIVAMTALAIVTMVLIAVSLNPSLLLALPPVLWPIVEIIKSINGDSPRTRRQGADPGASDQDGGGDSEEEDPDEEDGPERVDHTEGESVP